MKSLKAKFIIIFMALGLIPAIIISIISTMNSTADITHKIYNKLTAINQIKKQSIENYFSEREGDMNVLTDIADTMQQHAFMKLSAINNLKKSQVKDYFNSNNIQLELMSNDSDIHNAINELNDSFSNKAQWEDLLNKYDHKYKPLLSYFGWYDFFIINAEGTIVYSVTRENDLGKNISNDLTESSFYQAFELAKNSNSSDIQIGDFLPYKPSNNDPAAFIIKPIDNNNRRAGYIAYQQPLDKINSILGNREGMGKTGESYLVGQDELMRSDSYLNPSDFSVVASFAHKNKVQTLASKKALTGDKNTSIIIDYNGNPVVSSWDYIDIGSDIRWAIISEIDVSEALNPKKQNNEDFYKSYIQQYGYYDLFLIDSNGHIFYTVTKESDLNTNILTGKFSSSNLGNLIHDIKQTKSYGFVDYAPYEPSNGDPAAFIAQPLLKDNGQVALYVALQLPLEGIQNIMGIREGMGETGESYLVGDDLRMRSNSFLDPEGHSVRESFLGTIALNGVDTQAARRALDGQKGTEIIIDYNGNPVLSSYDLIEFGNFNWAILSEIDEAEAFASIRSNTMFMIVLMIIIVGIVAIIGMIVAKGITSPISRIADTAQKVANGDLTMVVNKTSNDEVGHLQLAIGEMITNLSKMVSNISLVSIQQATASEELAAITSQTNATVSEQKGISKQLTTGMKEMEITVSEVSENTVNTSVAVDDIKTKVNDGTDKLDEAYASIVTMSDNIHQSEQSVQKVRSDFDQVVNILDVIKSIADQTNLLALNAAIEAARAGDQGRGFAVVADEVRQLAQRTQDSTKEINDVINTIMVSANASVDVMASSVEHASKVQETAKSARELNQVITNDMSKINQLSTQIATATEEQSVVVDGILRTVDTLNTSVMETSQATDNISESSIELARLATELARESSAFKTR